MSTIDINLIERFTGQRRIATLEVGRQELNKAETALSRALRNDQWTTTRLRNARVQRRARELRAWFAKLPHRFSIPAWVILLTGCSTLSLTSALIGIFLFKAGLLFVLLIGLAPFMALPLLPVFFPENTKNVEEAAVDAKRQVEILLRDRSATKLMLHDCAARHTEAKRLYDGIVRARDFPLNRLLSADFRQMSGSDFEEYLAEVFMFLGYSVRRTGRTGDQGVDLVITRSGRMVAVQAKCYGNSVGNSAIQEVFAGMQFYSCHRCVVITNSTFTRGGIELANAVGCILVSGPQISDLVRGKIVVD